MALIDDCCYWVCIFPMTLIFTWLPASNNYIWFQKTSLYGFERLHKKLWVWDATIARFRGYYFQFGSVFIKKKPNRNQFKPVWLGFLVWLDFFRFGSFFLVWLGFFGLGSVRFFWFQAYKTETEPNRSVFSKF